MKKQKRLSIADLKKSKAPQKAELMEKIKGGTMMGCHKIDD